jgi:hypothetical protein
VSDEVSLGIQIGSGKPQIIKGISMIDVEKLVAKESADLAARLKTCHSRIDAIHKDVTTNADLAVEYFQLKQREATRDDLLGTDLANYAGEAVISRIEQYHRYAEVGSALLYKDVDFRGTMKFFTITWPNFKWAPYCFNDAASSAKAWGANILFQDTWYGGRRLYLIGAPYFEAKNLGTMFDFNDRASSFASLP